jgi:hypothetical protein
VATRAAWLGKNRPGTVSGELLRMIQYKGYITSLTMKSGMRALDAMFDNSGSMPVGRYVVGTAINLTVLGALSLQLKNIAMGKDPESMETANFWLKAMAQGGAGGMLGDFVKTMVQTRSQDDAGRMLNPTSALLVNTYALTTGNAAQWWEGDKTNFGREAVRYAKGLTPRLWMTNLAVDRLFWDTLQRQVDPDASGSFDRLRQQQYKNTGQSYFAKPGAAAADWRVPNMGAAFAPAPGR